MTLKKWALLCCILVLPCAGMANLLIYLGPPDQPPFADRDGDGLPDAWEQEHFGHLDFGTTDDPDHDGIDNAAEFARDTRPEDASSMSVTLYVSASSGQTAYDGLARTWDGVHGPKPTINSALAASFAGDAIHVLPGLYPENVNISGVDVTLTGEGIVKGTP